MTLTDLETKTLNLIITSEFQSCEGDDVIGSPVWTFNIVDSLGYEGINAQAAGGVMASLKNKGAVTISEYDSDDDVIAMTAEGFAALNA